MRIIDIQGYNVMIDDEDYEFATSHTWYVESSSLKRGKIYFFYMKYIYESKCVYKHKRQSFHRLLMNAPDGLVVDHIDGNTLNCQKNNMRLCTQAENNKNMRGPRTNTSGYKGVSWHKGHKKWRADINVNGHQKSLGIYDDPKAAYQVYCEAKKKYHGPYGRID